MTDLFNYFLPRFLNLSLAISSLCVPILVFPLQACGLTTSTEGDIQEKTVLHIPKYHHPQCSYRVDQADVVSDAPAATTPAPLRVPPLPRVASKGALSALSATA
jgi:hypothetical protein